MTVRFRRYMPIAACAAPFLCAAAFAHDGDPKALTPHPVYLDPGWRGTDRGGPSTQFPSLNVTLLSWFTPADFGSQNTTGNSCTGYTSPSGREYAVIGLSDGTGFVDITDPVDARIVGFVAGPESLWRDVRCYDHYCYAVSEGGGGIQVINLDDIDNGVITQLPSVTTGGALATHSMTINMDSGYLYRAGGSGNGIRVYSLANPAVPQFVGAWSNKYTHEATVISYTSGPQAGREIAYLCGGFNGGWNDTGLDIVDVTDKTNLDGRAPISRVTWPNAGYSHQIWLSPDLRYGYLNDELDEQNLGIPMTTIVIDLQNPAAPAMLPSYTNGNTATGHNIYTRDSWVIHAAYRSGIRIHDASANPAQPVEVAWFDTWPQDDGNGFNGLWNTYSWFPSKLIIGSDIEKGLFIWQAGEPRISFDFPDGAPTLVAPTAGTVRVEMIPADGTSIVPGSETMRVKIGNAPSIAIPLTSLGGNLYRGDFPSMPCGTDVAYYFSGRTSDGFTWYDVAHHATAAVSVDVVVSDAFEVASGWTGGVAGDTATAGIWTRGNPNGTAAQPEDDHSDNGVNCWFTGQGSVGGGVGTADVDGGYTTLLSPVFDLTTRVDPVVSYWRWYSNDQGAAPNADVFRVDISNNNGSTWTNVETVGPSGPETAGGWFGHSFRVAEFVTPTAQVRLRFIAEDAGSGSIVEAALDDFDIRDVECEAAPCPGDLNGDRLVDLSDLSVLLSDFGCTGGTCGGDLDGDGDADLADLSQLLSVFGTTCP